MLKPIKIYRLLFTFLIAIVSLSSKCQNLSVGISSLEDYYRRNQLLGLVDSTISFTIRPISLNHLLLNEYNKTENNNYLVGKADSSKILFSILPLEWKQRYNSHHPYGRNDGIMIPSKGYQTVISGGIYFKSGIFNVQLRPEYLFAENNDFIEYPVNYNGNDVPQRFGNKAYQDFSWGQSRIGLNLGPISLAVSNENLWWGPGLKNSILISNTATGFKHITLNTIKPIKTYIGSFETQIIAANLESSGFLYSDLIDKRYFTALAFNYQTKWFPGIFLGLNRSFQTYSENLKTFSDYIPLFRPYQKIKDKNQDNFGSDENDQLTSIYVRWLLKKAHAEVYYEYGKNDNSFNLRDFFLSPQHSRAYLFGARKLVFLNKSDKEYLEIGVEVTQLSQSIDRVLRGAGSWYNHYQIFQGHTNRGEVLGAGIGPGGNLQTLNLNWNKGFKSLGLQFERYEHQADFYDANFSSPINNSQWIDLGIAAISNWDYKHFLLNTKLEVIRSSNYQWMSGFNNLPKKNVTNLNMEVGITYLF